MKCTSENHPHKGKCWERNLRNLEVKVVAGWPEKKGDPVNHPKHYTHGRIETIDVIEDWKMPFHPGNAIKYIARHLHKGHAKQDIEKAIWYLNRYLTLLP